MKKIGDKAYKKEAAVIKRKITIKEKEIHQFQAELEKLSKKHSHKGPMTLTGFLNKKAGYKSIDRKCRVCGINFTEVV